MVSILLDASQGFFSYMGEHLANFASFTGVVGLTYKHVLMILIGCVFIFLGVFKEYEPLLLIPIGFGIIIGNIPFKEGYQIGIYESGSVLSYLYYGVIKGFYPPLIFLGIGAMTDFSNLIANPKLVLIGAAAQFGIFGAYMVAIATGFFSFQEAGAIGIIGGADGPTAIFLSSQLAPQLM